MRMNGHYSKYVADLVLSHWFGAVLILLAVAALGAYHSDLYPPSTDEYYSMHNAGWTSGALFFSAGSAAIPEAQ